MRVLDPQRDDYIEEDNLYGTQVNSTCTDIFDF